MHYYACIMQKLCKLCKNYANYAKIMLFMQVSENYANYASPTLLMSGSASLSLRLCPCWSADWKCAEPRDLQVERLQCFAAHAFALCKLHCCNHVWDSGLASAMLAQASGLATALLAWALRSFRRNSPSNWLFHLCKRAAPASEVRLRHPDASRNKSSSYFLPDVDLVSSRLCCVANGEALPAELALASSGPAVFSSAAPAATGLDRMLDEDRAGLSRSSSFFSDKMQFSRFLISPYKEVYFSSQ